MAKYVAWMSLSTQSKHILHNKTTRDFHVSSLDIKTEELEHKNNTSV